MKKIFSLLLAGALGFGFVSCQKDSPKTQTEVQTPKGYSMAISLKPYVSLSGLMGPMSSATIVSRLGRSARMI